ncbi:MAG: DUF4923 family protein, partial [Muribaculaceae bacterium]|nr:DUF4923 family protein [Muribaculaceae bacterium]
MKKIIIAAAFITSALCAPNAAAFDPSALLNALRGDSTATVENSSEKENSSGNSSGGILGALGGFINNTIANNKFTVDDLVGSWSYVSPAVSFQSDNALMKIGGAGAATAVESKLEPYYKTLGFNRMTLTVADDHSFEMKLGILILKGTVEKDDDGN